MNTAEIINRGMECLEKNLGIIEAEQFISTILRENFDYTKWQRDYYDRFTPEQLHERAVAYAESHPYQGNAKEIIG